MFYKDDRMALFIDGANLHAAGRALGFDIDYNRYRHAARPGTSLSIEG